MNSMNDEERAYWAACAGIDGLGRKAFERILLFKLHHELTWSETWQAMINNRQELYLTPKQFLSLTKFTQMYTPASYFDWLLLREIKVLTIEDKEYPLLLQEIEDKPFVLFTKGAWKWNKIPIAVVGTRQVSSYGKMVTNKIVGELVPAGATIISGFMYGVDTLAHQSALANKGHTVGVLGYGFDHCFPRSHAELFSLYLDQGMTFVTEFPPHVRAYSGNFPVRNRIVAGMSLATIVTEAAAESGSLITARLALDYNRLVCAVPAAITNPHFAGTKYLINEGAKLISSGQEVLEDLKYQLGEELVVKNESQIQAQLPTGIQQAIYTQLSSQSLTIDDLCEELALSVSEISVELSLMELAGIVERAGEGWQLK